MEFNQHFNSLTSRQKEVLERFVLSQTDKQIADDLKITEATVRKHIETICNKLNIKNNFSGQSKRADLIAHIAKYQPDLLPKNETIESIDNNNNNDLKNTINWRERSNPETLPYNLKLKQNVTDRGLELNLYVPLGLMERKEQQRRPLNEDFSINQVYQLPEKEEITRKFEHQEFLDHIGLGTQKPSNHKNIAIIGEPGAGKTTLLDKLAHIIHSENKGFPICISLANLEPNQTIEDYLENKWLNNLLSTREVSEDIKNNFAEQFTNPKYGEVWLLLDGLDEMKASSPVEALTTIEKYINTSYLVKARVVLSCRVNVWDASLTNPLRDFNTYRTLEFAEPQRDDFIRQWFTKTDKLPLGEKLIDKLKETGNERICELVKNPLRLVLLCRIWTLNQGELPETKAKFYQRYFPYFYNWKKQIIDLTGNYEKQDQLHDALGKLAIQGIDNKSRYRIKGRDAYKIMGQDLFKLAVNLGWLNIVDRDSATDEEVYAFYHPTFQEYFAACAVSDWDFFLPKDHVNQPVPDKNYRIFDAKWKEVILLWIGRETIDKNEKEAFIKALVEFKEGCKDFYYYRAYFLAAVAIDQFKGCSLGDDIVGQIVTYCFGSFDSEKQQWTTFLDPIEKAAREILPETDPKRAIAGLIDMIRTSESEETRRTAAYSLREIVPGNPEAIAGLIDMIRTSESEETRGGAAYSLGKINPGNPVAIAALTDIIRTSEDEDTRSMAANSLGKIGQGNPEVIAGLIDIIRTSESEYTRRRAAYRLGEIDPGNPEAIAALIDIIRTSEDEDTRRWAAYRLGEIGQGNPEAIAALIDIIRTSESEYTRYRAAQSLGKIDPGNPEAIAAFIDIIRTSESEYTRYRAAQSLGKIGQGNPEAIAALIDIIRTSEDEDTRRLAADSLGKIDPGNPVAIAGLIDIIRTSESEYTRRWAAESLGEIGQGNPEAIAGLIDIIRTSESEYTRRRAAYRLGEIDPGNPEAIAALIDIIRTSEDKLTRRTAAESLGKMEQGNPEAISAVIDIIRTTEDEYIRRTAAESLGKIIQDEQMAEVVKELKDYLSDEIYENEFYRFKRCYQVIWKCAQTLTYPEFYQTWHDLS